MTRMHRVCVCVRERQNLCDKLRWLKNRSNRALSMMTIMFRVAGMTMTMLVAPWFMCTFPWLRYFGSTWREWRTIIRIEIYMDYALHVVIFCHTNVAQRPAGLYCLTTPAFFRRIRISLRCLSARSRKKIIIPLKPKYVNQSIASHTAHHVIQNKTAKYLYYYRYILYICIFIMISSIA